MFRVRSIVGLALVILYLPAALLAALLLFQRHGRPRMPWIYLLLFSLVRVASGIVVILYEGSPHSTGLIVAALTLLNMGLLPLMNATVGLLRLIIDWDMKDDPMAKRGSRLSRILFFGAIALIGVGISLNAKHPTTAATMTKAGYIVMVAFFALLVISQVYLWALERSLSPSSRKALHGTLCSIPFLILRLIYLLLSVFHPDHGKWSPLWGAVAPLILMDLVMEYIVVCLFIGTGYRIPATKTINQYSQC